MKKDKKNKSLTHMKLEVHIYEWEKHPGKRLPSKTILELPYKDFENYANLDEMVGAYLMMKFGYEASDYSF